MSNSSNLSNSHWNPILYDGGHSYISHYGLDLLTWLNPQSGEKILDAGCATGDITHKLAETGADVIGVDSSGEMIAKAREKYPQLTFQEADITSLSFYNQFDGVISNAVLHWVKDGLAAATSIHTSLKPGGRFVAEMGGKDNVATIVTAIEKALDHFGYSGNKARNPWVFFSVGEYSSLLEKVGFRVREVIYFDRPTPLDAGEAGLHNWLDMFANVFFQGIPQADVDSMYLFIEDELRGQLFKEGKWWADYKRLRVRVEKP